MRNSGTDKVILYGAGRRCRSLLERFPGCETAVEFSVDRMAAELSEAGLPFPVAGPEKLKGAAGSGRKIVVTPKENAEIIRFLTEETGFSPADILLPDIWIRELIRNRTIRLQPPAVRLDICTLCQLNCPDCPMRYDDGARTIGSGFVPVEVFRRFLADHPFVKTVEISNNGEPFLHPQIGEILSSAAEAGVCLTVDNGTNFERVPEEVFPALVSGTVRKMRVSADGASQEVYSRYRRGGSFARVLDNLRRLNALKEETGSPYPELVWNYVLMEHDLDDLERAQELAAELHMRLELKETWNPEKAARVRELREVRSVPVGRAGDAPSAGNELTATDFASNYCRDMLLMPQINWDGRLLGCCTVYKSDWGMNVFRDGLLACINSDLYRDTVVRLMEGGPALPGTPCADCPTAAASDGAMRIRIWADGRG